MIIALTGANGFIGRHLANRLTGQGYDVRLLSRTGRGQPACTTYTARLGVDPAERLIPFVDGADALVHCAGEIADPASMEATHVGGTRDLLAAARGRVGHWVQLSSVGVYGPVRDGVVTEQTPLRPAGPYEVTKAASDALVLEAAGSGGMTASILRPSIVFGADMPNASLRQMARAIRKGHFFFIGKPGASANYVHVDRVAEALDFCMTAPSARGRIFNLSDWTSMERFAGALAQGLGCRAPRRRLPEPLARLAARVGTMLPRFPLTPARVDALTGRARYPAVRLNEAGFPSSGMIEEDARALGAAWRT